jgi:hypothetical protein
VHSCWLPGSCTPNLENDGMEDYLILKNFQTKPNQTNSFFFIDFAIFKEPELNQLPNIGKRHGNDLPPF